MVQTTLRLPKELYKKLKAEAKRKGMTMNAYMISQLWEILRKSLKMSRQQKYRNILGQCTKV